jgi:hypothetical protein
VTQDADCVAVEWWHAWGGILPDDADFGAGCWATVVLGPSFRHPEEVPLWERPENVTKLDLKYLRSWDHHPSDEEKEALTPEEYRD